MRIKCKNCGYTQEYENSVDFFVKIIGSALPIGVEAFGHGLDIYLQEQVLLCQ